MAIEVPHDRQLRGRIFSERAFCALMLAGLLLGGCKRPEGARKIITYSIWGSVAQQVNEEEIARAFEAENPDIKVDIQRIGSRYAEKIQAMMVGEVAPDVMMVDIALYDEWASRGVLADVTDDVAAATGSDEMMPIPKKAFERNGRFYGSPNNCHGFLLFANLDVLAKSGVRVPSAGLTWDELIQLGPRIIGQNNGIKFLTALPSFDLISPSFDVQLFDNPNAPQNVMRDNKGLHDALTFYRKMYQSGYFAPPDVTADQGAYQLFRDGRVAFHFDGRWRTPDLAGKTDFEWDVFPPPAGPAGRITQHGGSALGIWSGSENKEAAHRFVRFYCSERGVKMAMQSGRTIPVLRNVAYGPEFLSLRPPASIERFCGTMEKDASRIMLYAPGLNNVRRLMETRIEQLLYEPETSVETIQRAIENDLTRWLESRKSGKAK